MPTQVFVGPGGLASIQDGVNAADEFGTVIVAPGVYNESVIINKTVQLHGAQYGVDARSRLTSPSQESIIMNNNASGIIQINADKVVIDGFTIQGNTLGPGMMTSSSFAGYWVFNNIIQNNVFGINLHYNGDVYTQVQQNFIRNNTQPGAASGNGIYSDQGAANIIISQNRLTGHDPVNAAGINFAAVTADSNLMITKNDLIQDSSIALTNTTNVKISENNLLDSNASAIFFGGGTNRTEIEHNEIQVNDNGIRVTNFFTGTVNTNIRAKFNDIQNNIVGLRVESGSYNATPSPLDATNNWWGSATGPSGAGPGTGDEIIDSDHVVLFDPWLTQEPPPVPIGCPPGTAPGCGPGTAPGTGPGTAPRV